MDGAKWYRRENRQEFFSRTSKNSNRNIRLFEVRWKCVGIVLIVIGKTTDFHNKTLKSKRKR